MGLAFWIKRFTVVAGVAFAILLVVELAKGHTPEAAFEFALLWSVVASTIFVAAGIVRMRRGQTCAACGDLPQAPPPDAGGGP